MLISKTMTTSLYRTAATPGKNYRRVLAIMPITIAESTAIQEERVVEE